MVRVLAIGATGQFAGLAVPALVSRGVQVRALVHDPAKQDRVRDARADQAVVGDLRDPVSMHAALLSPSPPMASSTAPLSWRQAAW
jgi:uncharacterized protein YbjT (DUF2867 family)